MLILDVPRHDIRLKFGVAYVELTLPAYQRSTCLKPSLQLPLELKFDDIRISLGDHSEDFVVGEKAQLPRSIFNANALNGFVHNAINYPIIKSFGRRIPFKRN